MVDVRELLEYNAGVRRKYLETLGQLTWEEFTKNREASFHSMRNIFVHTLGAARALKAYMENVEKRLNDYLDSLPKEGLNRKYTVKDDGGKVMKVSAEDVLIHVFEEEVHHRGELIALLWQIGIEPPAMGWKGP